MTHEPQGKYPQPAAVHHLDLPAEADRLTGQVGGENRQGENLARESGVSVVMMAMAAGDELERHSAPGVVTVQVLRGHVRLTADGREFALPEGHMVMLQPNVEHQHQAETDSVVLLTVTGGGKDG
jgi:quercetin dioxygenase-like cupin family protein